MIRAARIVAIGSFLFVAGAATPALADTVGPAFGGGGGGGFDDRCPAGEPWLTGINAFYAAWIDQIAGSCGTNSFLPWRGGEGGRANFAFPRCPSGQVVTSIIVKSGLFVDGVAFLCKTLSDAKNNSGTATMTTPIDAGGGGWNFPWHCPVGQAAVGLVGASGIYLDRLGLVCRDVP